MAKRIAKIFIMLLLIALIGIVLVGCSPRPAIDNGVQGGGGSQQTATPIGKPAANEFIKTATKNRHIANKTDGSEEWFVIDLVLDFEYNDYTSGALETKKFTLMFKANWNLLDNNKSELMIRMIDPETLTNVLGVYYLDRTMYVNIMDGVAGYENMSYRFNEINFSTIAQLISPLLSKFELDPLVLIMSLCSANTKVELVGLLERMGVKMDENFLGGIPLFDIIDGIAQNLIFDTGNGKSTYELSPDGKTEKVGVRLKVNDLLALLKDIGPILQMVGVGGNISEVSWTAFGLPDFDPILQQFFGFSLAKLRDNDWPKMTAFLRSVSTKQTVDDKEAFVLNGMEVDISCDSTDQYPKGQYNVGIKLSPFFLGARKNKIDIPFAGLDLSPGSTKYRDGGLLNLEAQLGLTFEAPKDTTITIGDIIGATLDPMLPNNNLDALKKVPINFGGSNDVDKDGKPITRYEFDLQLKVDLDLFNGANNRAEINLMCANGAGGLKTFLSVYLVGTNLYVYTEGMKGASFSIPNISIPNMDLTAMLFGAKGPLGIIMPYLNPDYVAPVVAASGAEGEAKNADGTVTSAPKAAPIDVLALLRSLITYKEYYDWTGEHVVNDAGNITLPGSDPSKPMQIKLDKAAINSLFGNFLPGADLGLEHILIETYLSHPQDSTRIEIMLPKNISAEIKVKDLAWMGRPTFDFTNVDTKTYTEVGGDADFFITMSGDFTLGIQKEESAAKIVLNLADLIQNFTENILLDIGLKVTDSAKTKISYLVKGNFNMKAKQTIANASYISFRDTSIALYLYANDMEQHFLMVYYNGTDDMLYLDLSNLPVLQQAIPLFKIFKPIQPNIKIKLGLDKLLDNQPKPPVLPLGAGSGNVTPTDLLMMALTGTTFTTTNAAGAPLDIVDLIGKLLEGLTVQDDTLSIVAANQILSVLLQVLNVKLGAGSVLPGANIYGKLNIMNPDPEKGFLELHLGLTGESNTEFLSLGVQLLKKISVEGNKEDYEVVDKNFDAEKYTNLYHLMETLVVSFEMGGQLNLNTTGEGFSLGAFLAKLIGVKYVDPYFNTIHIASELEFQLSANIDISGFNIKEDGTLVFDSKKLLNSEVLLELYDRYQGKNTRIIGIYYKNQDLYLKLSYFGIADIQLTGAGEFIYNLLAGGKLPPAAQKLSSAAGDVLFDVGGATKPEVRLGIIAAISPYGLTVSIAEGALTNLIGSLLGLKEEEKIDFGAVEIKADISDGIRLSLKLRVETITIEFGLGNLSISANPSDRVNVVLPPETNWKVADANSLLTSVKVRAEASIGVGGMGDIDLSPLISSLLSGSTDPNASKIDINVFIKNLGLEGARLYAVIEAELNFKVILQSTFRVTLYKGTPSKQNELLIAIFDGSKNKMYIKTQLFGICSDKDEFKELDITQLKGSFMKQAQQDASAVQVQKSPFASLFGAASSAAGALDPLSQFVQIIFVEGGIQLKVAQEALIFLFKALGIDATAFLKGFELKIDGELSIHPVSINLSANLNNGALTLDLNLSKLSLGFGEKIDNSDLEAARAAGKVTVIEGFTSIGIDIKGTLTAEVSSGGNATDIYFDDLIKNILGSLQLPAGINKDMLGTLGLMFKIIGQNGQKYPHFGGTLHYTLGGVINISDVKNLYLTLKLGTTVGANDVLDIVVRGSANAASATGVDIFVNAERLLGIKPFVIRNMMSFVGAFTGTGVKLKGLGENGKETPQFNRSGDVKNLFAGLSNQPKGSDAALANAVVLYLASNYKELGLQAPIVLDVGAGALYGILLAVAKIDIGKYLVGHDVFATISAGGEALLALDLGLQGFIKIGMTLDAPNIQLNPSVPKPPLTGYTELDDNFSTIRVKIDGKASFKGVLDSGTPPQISNDTIDIGNILGNFLTGVDLKILLNLLTDVDKTMKYTIDVAVNLKKLIVGDWTGISGTIELKDVADKLLIGAYYLDGNLFLDLTALNIGKIRIDNFAVFLGSMLKKPASAASAEALNALPSDPVLRNAALNSAAAAAYINILMGNDNGIMLEVTADAIALVLSAISVGTGANTKPIDGNAIVDAMHGIVSLKLGIFAYDTEANQQRILSLSVDIASYRAALEFNSVQIMFDDTNVRPPNYENWQADFGMVGELTEWIYVRTAFTFGWHLSKGMEVDFSTILNTFTKGTGLDMVSIAPVLKILNEFGQDFKLEIEAKVHFGNLMRDGTLLPDLINAGKVNIDVLLNSELSIKLICTTGDQNNEVVSLNYQGGNLYVDLSAFSIGRVVIRDAYHYFLSMFAPNQTPAALAYALPYSTKVADNANNSPAIISKQLAVLASFININIQSDAVALHVGTAGIFAILNLLNTPNKPLLPPTSNLTLEGLYNMINPLGDIDVAVWLMTKNNLLQLALTLKEWIKDSEGNITKPGDREIALLFGLSSDYKIAVGNDAVQKIKIPISNIDKYQNLSSDAMIGVATKFQFHINLKQGSVDNIFKDPLQSLLGSLLADIALNIGLRVMEDMSGVVTLNIQAEISLVSIIAGIKSNKFDLSGINAKIGVEYNGKNYATLVLSRGDLFADLSLLGGPKAMIKDIMGLIAPPKAASEAQNSEATAGNTPAGAPPTEGGQLLPKLPIALELLDSGLFITLKKAAFNTIFHLININTRNLGDWEVTDDLTVKLGLSGTDNPIYGADGKSFKLGAEVTFTEGATDILSFGIDLNGIGAQFSGFGIERPDAALYSNIMEVDTILAKTSLEFNLKVFAGEQVNLQKTLDALFRMLKINNPLGRPIAPTINTTDILQDTLRLDLQVMVNIKGFSSGKINDILAGIRVKAHLYSMERPDFFSLDIYFDNNTAFIDATAIGLGKIKLPIESLMERILKGTTPKAVQASQNILKYAAAVDIPQGAPAEAQARKALAITYLMFGKDGITAIVAYDTISTLFTMLGVPLGNYIDGVIAPSIELEVTDKFGFNITAHILTGNGAEDDEILKLGLSLVGQSTNVDVKISNIHALESFVPKDADTYVSYDELMLFLSINASISVDFLKGYIPLDDILDLLISNMKMGINIKDTHGIAFSLNGKIGLDLKEFLKKSPTAMFGELSLNYTITSKDGGSVYDQTLAKIFIAEDGVYVQLMLQDIGLDLKVKVPDLNIPKLIWNLIDKKPPFGTTTPPTTPVMQPVEDATTKTVPYQSPLASLMAAKAAGTEKTNALPILISLTSHELSIEISTALLATVMPLLGLKLVDPQAFVESILSGGKLAISVDPNFSIYLKMRKESGGDPYIDKDGNSIERGGYEFKLSLFHDTEISLNASRYLGFASRFTNAYDSLGYAMTPQKEFDNKRFDIFATEFLPFNLQKIITGGQFDVINDFLSALGGKVEMELGVDFAKQVLDLSTLFQNEEEAFFYIKVADALKGAVKLVLEFDVSLKGLIKDAQLGVDAKLSFEDQNGKVLLSLIVRGGGNTSSEFEGGVYPMVYLSSEAMGIPKLKINSPVLKQFANLDLNALLKSLGLKVDDVPKSASRLLAQQSAEAPQNAGMLDNSTEGLLLKIGNGTLNIANILDSISIQPGRVAIVLAKSIVKDLFAALFNFPFDDIYNISAEIADGLYLDVSIKEGFSIKMNLSTLEVNLGGRKLFGQTKAEVDSYFAGYEALNQYKWAFELESELTITDDLVSLFSLGKMTTPLVGADIVIEAGEVLNTKMTFFIRGFIDFSDLSKISLQLAMVSGGKEYLNIMYVGDANDPTKSMVYLDLTGLGLVSIKLNFDIGGMVKKLLGGLTAPAGGTTPAAANELLSAASGAADAMRPAGDNQPQTAGDLLYNGMKVSLGDANIDNFPFGSSYLLLALGSKEVSVAITGALVAALLHGLNLPFNLPIVNYIRVGYVEGKMAGVELVLNEEKFRIAYSFTDGCTSQMGTTVKNPVNPYKNSMGGDLIYQPSDIGMIRQIYFGLKMEIRIDTKKANGQKSSQLNGIESFVEQLMGVADGTVDLAPQDTSMIIVFDLQLALNLANPNASQLALSISYGDNSLIGVYLNEGSVYADLSGLGLFQAKISGLDVINLILGLLKDVLPLSGGLNVGDLINGLLPGPQNAAGGGTTEAAASNAADASRNTLQGAGVAVNPKVRVILTNDSLYIVPSMAAIGAIIEKITKKPLPFVLPEIAEIRLGINLKEGLNNLFFNLKLDNFYNGVDISIPADGGVSIRLNDENQKVIMPEASVFNTYGGITGLSLSNGGISLSTLALVSSLIDSIDAPNTLGLYIKKRNSYYLRTDVGLYLEPSSAVDPTKGPYKDVFDDGPFAEYRSQTQTSVGIVLKRDRATNYLEAKVDAASRNNWIAIRLQSSFVRLYLGNLSIKVLGISIPIGSLVSAFVKDGIQIAAIVLNTMVPTPPILGTTGSLSGSVKDEAGTAIEGVDVTLNKGGVITQGKTDAKGNYSFSGIQVGTYQVNFAKGAEYFEVVRGEYDVQDMQNLDKAQQLDVVLVKKGSASYVYNNVIVQGYVKSEGKAVSGATVYIDNIKVAQTNNNGNYMVYFDKIIGSQHSITVKAPNYKTYDGGFEVLNQNANVQKDATMERISIDRGSIRGKFERVKLDVNGNEVRDASGNVVKEPVGSDVEIWLTSGGATLRNKMTPINFLGTDAEGVRLGTLDTEGNFALVSLAFGTYKIKIRSKTYENMDLAGEITISQANPAGILDTPILLTRRPTTHFSQNKVTDPMVAGIRIRLGADKLDGDKNDSGAGNIIGNVFETGNVDTLDSVTYIEAWLGEDLVNGLLDMVHNLISSGLASLGGGIGISIATGYGDAAIDRRISPIDLVQTSNVYNENDMTIYDFKFSSRAEYVRYQTEFLEKFPAALLQNILSSAMGTLLPANVLGILKGLMFLIEGILSSLVTDISSIIASIFPFTMPYNLAENKDLPGNPLKNESDSGLLTNGPVTLPGGVKANRQVTYGEKSVYARIKLDQNNMGGLLDSIKLFINGAKYNNIDQDFTLKYDTVDTAPIVTLDQGVVNAANRTMIDEWLRKNTINDYVVIEDYITNLAGEKVLYNQSYIRNNETDPTKDDYFELDILNNGLYLKSAKPLSTSQFCNLLGNGSYSAPVALPEKIVFNNPYDLSDFTVIGGSWSGGIRSNTDKTKTPVEIKEILPNRNKVTFQNGGSGGSSGAHVHWSLSLVDFNPKGGNYYIIGSCLNQEVRIPCVVKPRLIDESNILGLLAGSDGKSGVPDIDPYNYNELKYVASLPKSFREGSQEVSYEDKQNVIQTGKYVFNQLSWDMKNVVISNKGGTYNAVLTYGFSGSGKGKVNVPIKVLDRTINDVAGTGAPGVGATPPIPADKDISGAVVGSEGGLDKGVVTFDPFKVTADAAVKALQAMPEVWLNTPTGSVRVPIVGLRDINFNGLQGANFDNLDFTKPANLKYTIYINVYNSDRTRTRVPVTVKILNKAVQSTSAKDLTQEERTVNPFRKGGLYDKDTGLSLPQSVQLRYFDGSVVTVQKNINYVWGIVLVDAKGVESYVYEGKKPDGTDNWRGLMSTNGGVYTYRMFSLDLKGQVERTNAYQGPLYQIEINVTPAKLTATEAVQFYPYQDISLPKTLHVGFNGGAVDPSSAVNVRWSLKDTDIFPSFTGKTYFSNIEVFDTLFLSEVMVGAQIVVKQAAIIGLDFGASDPVNPYFAAEEIDKLLRSNLTTLIVATDPSVRVTKDLYQIISWKISSATLNSVSVAVTFGNINYNANPVWKQERIVQFNTLDVSSATILPIEINSVFDGIPSVVSVKLGDRVYSVPVDFAFDKIDSGINFYKTYQSVLPFTPKGLKNITQNVTVRVNENKITPIVLANYTMDGLANGSTISAYSDFQLPQNATLDFGADKVRRNIPVIWDRVDGFNVAGGVATFSGRIGKAEIGFIPVTYTLNVTADSVGLTSLPDLITLDPLKDLAQQLVDYQTILANLTSGGTANLDVEFPLDLINLTWEGAVARAYSITVGRKIALTSGTQFICSEAKTIQIKILRRQAKKIEEVLVGHIYKEIDFAAMKEVSVVFETGEIVKSNIAPSNWLNLQEVDYSKANTYTVQLVVFADNIKLRQTIDVLVTVRNAVLVEAYKTYVGGVLGGKINLNIADAEHMVLDPFKGFEALPQLVYGKFDGIAEPVLMQTEWITSHIVRDMSIKGGTFTNDKHNAGRVTLFTLKGTDRVRPQQLTFEVEVLKSTVTQVEFSTDPYANEFSTYTTLEGGVDPVTGGLNYTKASNPYELTSYNENPLSAQFSYYRTIKVTLASGKNMYFNLGQLKYNIYDKKTGMPTNIQNLYTGRDIAVKIAANEENIFNASGAQVLAKDAAVFVNIDMRIYNMTYTSSSDIKADYLVDLYRDYFDNVDPNAISLAALRAEIKDITKSVTISGTDTNAQGSPYTATFNKGMKVSDKRLNVNYNGKDGFIEYTCGNDVGGWQTVSVLVKYTKRELLQVIDKENRDHYYRVEKDSTGKIIGAYTKGKPDPNININADYTKNFTDGFIFDPFENYKIADFFSAQSAQAKFMCADGPKTAKGGFEQVLDASGNPVYDTNGNPVMKETGIPVLWLFDRVFVDLNGGTFTVKATIRIADGASNIDQQVAYRFRVLKRKVISATSAETQENTDIYKLLSPKAKLGISVYDYIGAADIEAAVSADCFGKDYPEFTLSFTEGRTLKYKLGMDADYFRAENGGLTTEGTMKMNFRIDSMKPLNSKGKDVRFVMTVPGYGTGVLGQQNVYLYAKSKVQTIVDVQTWVTDTDHTVGTARPFSEYFNAKYNNTTNIEVVNGVTNAFRITNPYYFITPTNNPMGKSGLVLPTAVCVTVQEADGTLKKYAIESVSWQGTRSNCLTLSYMGGELTPTFGMPVDNQRYSFKISVDQMMLQKSDGNIFDERNGNGYSSDEVVLLPTFAPTVGSGVEIVGVQDGLATTNYGYRITFTNGKTEIFNGVTGGGNYRNSYNKWDFTSVNFSDYQNVQTVSMVLGGKGGQKVTWLIKVANKAYIGNSMRTIQLNEVSSAGAKNFNFSTMSEFGGKEDGTLPTRFSQYFNNNTATGAIPVSYGVLLNDSLNATTGQDEEKTNFTLNGGKVGIIDGSKASIAPPVTVGGTAEEPRNEKKASNVAAVKWTATTVRAYPNPNEEISGYLYFALTPNMSKVTNKNDAAYLHNPANDKYSYNGLAPLVGDEWSYPEGLKEDSTLSTDNFFIDKFTAPSEGATPVAVAQNSIPVIQVKRGAIFDVKYLPVFDLAKSTYYVPWHNAKVYKCDMTDASFTWNYDNSKIEVGLLPTATLPTGSCYNKVGSQYNSTLMGGIRSIDTSVVGVRYTLTLNLGGVAASGNYLIMVAIDVVE